MIRESIQNNRDRSTCHNDLCNWSVPDVAREMTFSAAGKNELHLNNRPKPVSRGKRLCDKIA